MRGKIKWALVISLVLIVPSLYLVSIFLSSSSIEIDKTAYVTTVIDGDTFDVSTGDRIRLADINAPEYGEKGFYEAKNQLISLVSNKRVYLDVDDKYNKDQYGRFVCLVYTEYNSLT